MSYRYQYNLISIFIGFSLIFTIHFGEKTPIFRNIHIKRFVKIKEIPTKGIFKKYICFSPLAKFHPSDRRWIAPEIPGRLAGITTSPFGFLIDLAFSTFRKCLYKQSFCQVISINTRKNSTYQEIYFYIP